jgi:hypothetical protein
MERINVKVVRFNNVYFPAGCMKDICCPVVVNGTLWMTPVLDTVSGEVVDHVYTKKVNNTPPQTDSMPIIRLTDSCGNKADVLIADNESANKVTDACALCCDDTPAVFNAAIKAPVMEIKLCADATGAKKMNVAYKTPTPIVVAATFNGAAPSPAALANYASAAAFVTWVGTNWGAYITGIVNDATNKIFTITFHSSVNTAGIKIS